MQIMPMGDSAIVIKLGDVIKTATLERVQAWSATLMSNPPAGTLDIVPAYNTITVFYDLQLIKDLEAFCADLMLGLRRAKSVKIGKQRTVSIPVCYGGEYGPDLAMIAKRANLTENAAIALHSRGLYLVHAVGFSPGFAYLGGLAKKLHAPRLKTPRTRVPAGSLGIGGAQTGVYPFSSPGGWNLIGRTPLLMFCADDPEPARLSVGDQVKFKPITAEEFLAWK
jgi:inhibitor of KinA|uniref:5-oxoprolinase subunit PxpB n=1 Tax=Cephaloticoccus sp. TaxID=1985742 RepID=UPI00404B4A72